MTTPEYQRGYRAGRKRTEDEAAEAQRRELRVQVFCTALQATMRDGRWRMKEEPVNDSDGYVALAMEFVDFAERKGLFR